MRTTFTPDFLLKQCHYCKQTFDGSCTEESFDAVAGVKLYQPVFLFDCLLQVYCLQECKGAGIDKPAWPMPLSRLLTETVRAVVTRRVATQRLGKADPRRLYQHSSRDLYGSSCLVCQWLQAASLFGGYTICAELFTEYLPSAKQLCACFAYCHACICPCSLSFACASSHSVLDTDFSDLTWPDGNLGCNPDPALRTQAWFPSPCSHTIPHDRASEFFEPTKPDYTTV